MGDLPAQVILHPLDRRGCRWAPAVTTWTPRGTSPRTSGGVLARPIRTVGAAQSQVTPSRRTKSNTRAGSTLGRQTWVLPDAVTVQVKVQPLACWRGVCDT